MALEKTDPVVQKLLANIRAYNSEYKKWEARVTKIIKRYRDDQGNGQGSVNEAARFNILWSNIQTLIPAVYSKMPKADVSRRFGDNDPVGRVASLLLERVLDYEIEHYPDFRSAMRNCVEDRFLGGRGSSWARYDPHIKKQDVPEDGFQITEDIEEGEAKEGDIHNQTAGNEGVPEEIDYECAPTDYVHWRDFGHTCARTWEEVTQVWRWVYMSKEAVTERFGKKLAKKIPFNSSPEALSKYGQREKPNDKAKICELWDKETSKVYWLMEDMPELLDTRDDPLGLEGFFLAQNPFMPRQPATALFPFLISFCIKIRQMNLIF